MKKDKPKPVVSFWEDIKPDFTESKIFRDYCDAILGVLTTKPMTIADLHRRVGREKMHLTLDALGWLSDKIENDGKIPCGFWLRTPKNPDTARPRWNGQPAPDKYAHARPRGVPNGGIK